MKGIRMMNRLHNITFLLIIIISYLMVTVTVTVTVKSVKSLKLSEMERMKIEDEKRNRIEIEEEEEASSLLYLKKLSQKSFYDITPKQINFEKVDSSIGKEESGAKLSPNRSVVSSTRRANGERLGVIKKSIVYGKERKISLRLPGKHQPHPQQLQQPQALVSIVQSIQRPFQQFFGLFNRTQVSSSSLTSSSSSSLSSSFSMAINTTLFTCSCRCGERNDETRIVGGSTTGVNEYPWMARLSYFNRFYCGGTLINDRYVLTAAHCIKGFMWFMIKVTFGEHDRCKYKDRPETRFVLRAFTQKFSFANFDNDIALLRLNDRVPITSLIKPICLPKMDERDNQFVGTKAIATGWGTLKEDGKPSCMLQEVTVPVLENDICIEQTNYTQKMITKNMMCAGYPGKGEKDSCQGDSGGPLIRKRDNEERYEQIGIVSWGNGCARPNYPGVYTRVTKYLDWIIENSKDGCFCEEEI